jgi:nucleoside-diphosphate-sugar epimerase
MILPQSTLVASGSKRMRVLISGAGGFLGRHFYAYYKTKGDEVVAFDTAKDRPEGVYSFEAREFFGSSGVTFDLAFHFAAVVDGREVIENDPMRQVENAALDAAFFRWAIGHTKVAIYPSSSAVYGTKWQKGEGHNLQESLFHPDQSEWAAPDEWYGTEKLMAEYLAWQAATKYKLDVLCIRPFSGYGEGQSKSYPVPAICERAINREDPLTVWGSGDQSRDFVHVSDLVGATVARLEAGVEGYQRMNIGTGAPTTFVEVAKTAADIVGYSPKIETDKSKPEGVHARYADVTEMLRYYQPVVSLREGLVRTMAEMTKPVV